MTLHAFETLPSVSLSRNSPTLFLITFCSVFIGHSPVARSAQFIRECQTKSRLVQVTTIRTKLLKIGAHIRVTVRRVRVSLSSAFPSQRLFQQVWANLRC